MVKSLIRNNRIPCWVTGKVLPPNYSAYGNLKEKTARENFPDSCLPIYSHVTACTIKLKVPSPE